MAKWIYKKYQNERLPVYGLVFSAGSAGDMMSFEENQSPSSNFGILDIEKSKKYGKPYVDLTRPLLSAKSGEYCVGSSAIYGDIVIGKIIKIVNDQYGTYYYFENYYSLEPTGEMADYKGTYVGEVTAEDGTYTNNAKNPDGFWYVKDRPANRILHGGIEVKSLGKVVHQRTEW